MSWSLFFCGGGDIRHLGIITYVGASGLDQLLGQELDNSWARPEILEIRRCVYIILFLINLEA